MYTVSKGPSKISLTKTRRGVTQNFDRLENTRIDNRKPIEVNHEDNNVISNPTPKIVFQGTPKRSHYQREPDVISPQHEEIIKYVRESWADVCDQYNYLYNYSSNNQDNTSQNLNNTIVYYNDGERSPQLNDFKPFDLEQWWGKRMFNSIIKSQPA